MQLLILGCGGGGNGVDGGIISNVNDNSPLQQTCLYPQMNAAVPPFDIPEIPQFPKITSYGNTYHVNKDHPNAANFGNDGSIEQPWKDLQFAIDNLKAGDKLFVHAASSGYSDEWYEIGTAGDKNNWITIEGVRGLNGEKVIMDNRLTFLSSSAYILVKNIDIHGGGYSQLDLRANVNNLLFDNMEIDCHTRDDNYTGVWIDAGVNNVWFRNMDIHHCGYMKENPTDPSGVYMMTPSNEDSLVDYITFINVQLRNNKGDGIGGGKVGSVFFDGCSSSNNTGDGYDVGAKTRSVFKNCVAKENGGDQGQGFKIWSRESWIINCQTYYNEYPGVVSKPAFEDSEIYILNSIFKGDNQHKYGGEIRIENIFSGNIPDLSSNKAFLYNNIFHTINTVAVFFEDISNQTLAGENNNAYFSSSNGIAFEFRDNTVVDRSYSIIEMGDGTWYSEEGFGDQDIGTILDDECYL